MKYKKLGLLVLIACIFISGVAIADNIRESGLYTYKIKGNGTISIVDFDWEKNNGDIYIPSMVDGYTVTAIESEAFADGKKLNAAPCLLVLPNTITLIEEKAFYNSSITTVSIPASLQSLGKGAFAYCDISQFIVDPSQTNFADIDGVLYNKKTRTLLAYPQKSVSMAKVPEGIVAIDDYAFCGILIGGYETLSQTSEIIQFNELLPSTIKSIGAYAFENCVLYYDAAVSSQNGTFQFNNGDVKLLPDAVTEVGDRAFANCSFRNGSYNSASKLTIGTGVESIGNEAFKNCRWYDGTDYMLYITAQEKVDSIGEYAFADSEIYTLGNEVASVRIVLPSEIEEIGEYAFASTHWVDASNTIEVEEIAEHSFQNTVVFSSLKTAMYQEDMPQSLVVWGDLSEIPASAFAYYYQDGSNSINKLEIQDGVKKIGKEAFAGLASVTKVSLPNSLREIDEKAFSGCRSLTELTIPAGVSEIGDDAFERQIITLTVERDSYAALWASENGYNHRFMDEAENELDWLNP